MRVVLVMLARNEADVIGHNLRWHLSTGVDHAIVMDHSSTDSTPEVLRELGSRVTVIRRSGPYNQAEMTSEMCRLARDEHGADWIMPVDADEFWVSSGNVKEAIAKASGNVIRAPTTNFVPTTLDNPAERNPVLRMHYKVSKPPKIPKLPYVLKPSQSKVMFEARGFRQIFTGNHDVEIDNPHTVRGDVAISHYPLRSLEHFYSKVIQGGAAIKNFSPKDGYHWRRWYGLYQSGLLDREWRRLNLGRFTVAALQALQVVSKDLTLAERI
jgi:glycosyltransferase involved in cell wall biosynthesis